MSSDVSGEVMEEAQGGSRPAGLGADALLAAPACENKKQVNTPATRPKVSDEIQAKS